MADWYDLSFHYHINDKAIDCRRFGDVDVPTDDIAEFFQLTGMRWDENKQRTKMRFFDAGDIALFKMKFGIE